MDPSEAPYRTTVDAPRLRATIAFLNGLLEASAQGGAVEIDQQAARRAVAATLALKDPARPMGAEMYDAFALHATNCAVEGVCFRTRRGRVEVLLQQRSDADPLYRHKRAVPGQVMRPSDRGPDDALARLTMLEFKVPTTYEYVGEVYIASGLRGWFNCKIFLAFPDQEPAGAEWYPADPLPPDTDAFTLVPSHRNRLIPLALSAYARGLATRR
jgi:hypothetical protein